MPADRIQAAIDRGTGAGKGEALEELRYEGYGPSGVAIMVDAVTDNRNRTAPAIRRVFSKYGGNLGESNSVAWMFDRKGVITVRPDGRDPEEIGLAAIEAGADDVQVEAESVEISTDPASFEQVRAALERLGVTIENAELTMQPRQTVAVEEDKAPAVLRLLEALEEEEDVQQVYANFDIPADVLERVSAQV
jgi:YebC/PmpR family DNA-binding regulatory protein